ncbi:acyl carrier protein [Amycolatopsis pithecellobii]|uniref:Uncharacterized protein n=1 Tax=Amycolatopsis pithecellobii TaxID=664692 RepID=A0A6N7YLL7_9PSEU|nr:acyl carrier protein [Amycolatopsis pithecellobii]MTD53817.1 hypothetical protein [Amycolatopsis pithecellobii]
MIVWRLRWDKSRRILFVRVSFNVAQANLGKGDIRVFRSLETLACRSDESADLVPMTTSDGVGLHQLLDVVPVKAATDSTPAGTTFRGYPPPDLVGDVEKAFRIQTSDDELMEITKFGDLARIIEQPRNPQASDISHR